MSFFRKRSQHWEPVYKAWPDTFLGDAFTRYTHRYNVNMDGSGAEEFNYDSQGGYWHALIPEKERILRNHMKRLPDGRWLAEVSHE